MGGCISNWRTRPAVDIGNLVYGITRVAAWPDHLMPARVRQLSRRASSHDDPHDSRGTLAKTFLRVRVASFVPLRVTARLSSYYSPAACASPDPVHHQVHLLTVRLWFSIMVHWSDGRLLTPDVRQLRLPLIQSRHHLKLAKTTVGPSGLVASELNDLQSSLVDFTEVV